MAKMTLTQSMINDIHSANATIKVEGTTANVGTTIYDMDMVSVQCNVGYEFTSDVRFRYDDPTWGDIYYVTLTRPAYDTENRVRSISSWSTQISDPSWKGVQISTVSNAPVPVLVYEIKGTDLTNFSDNNVTLELNGVPVVSGDKVYVDDVLLFIADEGYYIDEQDKPNLYADDGYGVIERQYFTLQNDSLEARLEVEKFSESSFVPAGFRIKTIEYAPPVTVGTNNVYVVTNEILHEVNEKRFVPNSTGGSYDYGQYIINVVQIPFDLDPTIIGGQDTIRLGEYDTSVVADRLSTDKIEVDLGTIQVAPDNNNLLDYTNTVALLFLPFVDPVELDLDYVMGYEIGITYSLDVYTGETQINIYSSKVLEVYKSVTAIIGVSVPYGSSSLVPVADNINIVLAGDNNIRTPFIELFNKNSDLVDGMFTIPVVVEEKINTATGYIEVQNVDLDIKATNREVQEIVSTLQTGVIIK